MWCWYLPERRPSHLERSLGSAAVIAASLHFQSAMVQTYGEGSCDAVDERKWASECRADEHEDADQHSEDLGLHGGSESKD
jgi:hypothetical protein